MTVDTPKQFEKTLSDAAFIVETVAHLRGLESDLLPTAVQLREAAQYARAMPVAVMPDEAERISGVPLWALVGVATLVNTVPSHPGFILAMERANTEKRFVGAHNVGEYVDGYLKSMIYAQRRLDDHKVVKEDPKTASKRARDLGTTQ